jgi:hypothetical protein
MPPELIASASVRFTRTRCPSGLMLAMVVVFFVLLFVSLRSRNARGDAESVLKEDRGLKIVDCG